MSSTFAGVWRQGSDGHLLWVGASWASFEAKWKEFSAQNMRLVNLETYLEGNQRRWAGVWRQGSDGHYLWAGVDWDNFKAKWQELSQQNLRLVDVEVYQEGGAIKWCGVWRQGSDAHYLWVAAWPSFQAKWQELSQQNLRLVDIDTYMSGNTRMWVGVWRQGSDGHYLWADVDWQSLVAKWKELAPQNLRLVDIETWVSGGQQRWAGVWRQGSDPYYLWSAPDRENFLGKWNELAKGQLRLLKMAPLDAACGDDCANQVVAPDRYVYYVSDDPDGPYRWPVDDDRYVRPSALSFSAQPFTLPFTDRNVVHWGTWRYSDGGDYHHAIDYLREDWKTFRVRAAAPGKVVYVGWDWWSGGTIIVSHTVGGVADSFRSIYMHLRNGPAHDVERSWTKTVPNLSGTKLTNFKAYLNGTGAKENPAQRNPDPLYWGTESEAISPSLLNSNVVAGDHLAWAGCTGPGGCGCTGGWPSHPNTHLHIFFARRDRTDNQWYFIDPYGVYGPPSCCPGVTQKVTGPCVRYSVAWKDGQPQYPVVSSGAFAAEAEDDEADTGLGEVLPGPLDLGENPYAGLVGAG